MGANVCITTWNINGNVKSFRVRFAWFHLINDNRFSSGIKTLLQVLCCFLTLQCVYQCEKLFHVETFVVL